MGSTALDRKGRSYSISHQLCCTSLATQSATFWVGGSPNGRVPSDSKDALLRLSNLHYLLAFVDLPPGEGLIYYLIATMLYNTSHIARNAGG